MQSSVIQGTPRQGLFGATLGFFAGFAAVALFGPTASKFNEVMGLSPLMVGFLVAIPSLSGSLLRIPFGAWVDTAGGRKPFLILLSLSLVGMVGLLGIVLALYPHGLSAELYPLLLLLGALSGCGIATFSVGVGQVSYWFPQARQGAALGAYAGLGNLAPGLFSLLLPLALVSIGLGGAYLAWSLFLALGLGLYAWSARNAPYFQLLAHGRSPEQARQQAQAHGQEIFPRGSARQSLAAAARAGQTWLLTAIYFTSFGGFIALTAWLPTYWRAYFELSPVLAGVLTALYSLTASGVRVAGGSLADRLGGERSVRLALLTTLAGALLMSFSANLALSIGGIILMAIGMGIANAGVFKLMPQYIPQAVGGAAGWIGGLGAFGGFALPPILGAVVRWYGPSGYAGGFLAFAALALLSLALSALLRTTRAPQAQATPRPAAQ